MTKLAPPPTPARSLAPTGESYDLPTDVSSEERRLRDFGNAEAATVVVQGIGFVGSAMLAALARVRDDSGRPLYNVIGIDLADARNYWKIGRLNEGKPPVESSDERLAEAIATGVAEENLTGTFHPVAYELADVVVVDINLDVQKDYAELDRSEVDLTIFRKALGDVAARIREDALVVIETTVPPGTTERVVAPIFREAFAERGLDSDRLHLAHAPERVMPGPRYLESIAEFHRVYAGINEASAERARQFLESFIDTERFPLTRLQSPTASETAKVLENAYRAANIAFIQEWTELAHRAGIDLFEVIEAIHKRPTHANLRWPGLGVGGYCLTKDALLANWANRTFFGAETGMPQCLSAIAINDRMPEFTCRLIEEKIGGLEKRTALLLGVSYLNDVADTRYSPTETVYDFCRERFASVHLHDPHVAYWPEREIEVTRDLDLLPLDEVDTLLFLVGHRRIRSITPDEWLRRCPNANVVVDANNVITNEQRLAFEGAGLRVIGTGKGDWGRDDSKEPS